MLSTGTPLHDVSHYMGHNNYSVTTLMYIYPPLKIIKTLRAVSALEEKLKWVQKVLKIFLSKKKPSPP
jgi:hypothetical protein